MCLNKNIQNNSTIQNQLGTDRRKEEREDALAAAATQKADEAPVIVKEIMPTRKRGAPRGPQSGLPQPPLRRFKSVQGGREVLLHVGEGDSAEALLGQSGFRLYKRNLSEPAPPPLAPAKSAASPSVSPPKMMRLPMTVHSAPPNVNMFSQTMMTSSANAAKGKTDFLPSPTIEPIVPELKRSDSDGDSGGPDETPLNLSIPRDVIRTDNPEGGVLVVVEPSVDTPQSVVRPAPIPALMPIRDGKKSN